MTTSKVIVVTAEEAMLIDWLLTLHTWGQEYLDWLSAPDWCDLRVQVGTVIVNHREAEIDITDTISRLLVLTPITFRFGKDDVGLSLKTKLYRSHLGPLEVSCASKDSRAGCQDEDASAGTPDGSAPTSAEPVSP